MGLKIGQSEVSPKRAEQGSLSPLCGWITEGQADWTDMAHTQSKLFYHCIFSTKGRRALIKDAIRPRLYAYIGSILRAKDSDPLAIGGTADHVHLLIELPGTLPVADAMRLVKTNSSKWLRETFPPMPSSRGRRGMGRSQSVRQPKMTSFAILTTRSIIIGVGRLRKSSSSSSTGMGWSTMRAICGIEKVPSLRDYPLRRCAETPRLTPWAGIFRPFGTGCNETGSWSHGSRRGLRSFVPSGLQHGDTGYG